MTWDTYIVILLRNLIGDVDSSNYTYSDARLQTLIASCAVLVQSESSLENSYVVDLTPGSEDITPDPVTEDDQFFVVLLSYKAACILAGSRLSSENYDNYRIEDDRTIIDIKGRSRSNETASDNHCDLYDSLVLKGSMTGQDGVRRWGVVVNTYALGNQTNTNFR